MGFLGTGAGVWADLVLLGMSFGFALLFTGALHAKRKNVISHIKLVNMAVLLGSLSFLWMGFSLVSTFLALVSFDLTGLIIVMHTGIGMIALFTGILFTLDEMRKTRSTMRAGFMLWTLAMVLGLLMYIRHYM